MEIIIDIIRPVITIQKKEKNGKQRQSPVRTCEMDIRIIIRIHQQQQQQIIEVGHRRRKAFPVKGEEKIFSNEFFVRFEQLFF